MAKFQRKFPDDTIHKIVDLYFNPPAGIEQGYKPIARYLAEHGLEDGKPFSISHQTVRKYVEPELERRNAISAAKKSKKALRDSSLEVLHDLMALHIAETKRLKDQSRRTGTFDANKARAIIQNVKLLLDADPKPSTTGPAPQNGDGAAKQASTLDRIAAAMRTEPQDHTPSTDIPQDEDASQTNSNADDDTHHSNETRQDASPVGGQMRVVGPDSGVGLVGLEGRRDGVFRGVSVAGSVTAAS